MSARGIHFKPPKGIAVDFLRLILYPEKATKLLIVSKRDGMDVFRFNMKI